MLIYLFLFTPSLILAYYTQKEYKKKKKVRILSAIGVLYLCVIAGIRDVKVGIDVSTYLLSSFNLAGRLNLLEFLKNRGNDFLFYASVWLVRKITSDVHAYLFLHQLVIAAAIYFIAYKKEIYKNGSFPLYILSYLIIWFGVSLNILRQSVAIAIVMCAYEYLINKKWSKYILYVTIAVLFHTSIVIAYIFPIITLLSQNKNGLIYTFIGGIFGIIVVRYLEPIFNMVNFLGVMDKYSSFFNTDQGNFSPSFFAVELVIFCGLLLFEIVSRSTKDREIKVMNSFLLLNLIGYSASLVIKFGYRISYPFMAFQMLAINEVYSKQKKKWNKIIFVLFIISSLLVYFWVRYIKCGYDGIIPYNVQHL